MAKFLSKILEFGGTGLRRSSVILRKNLERSAPTSTTLITTLILSNEDKYFRQLQARQRYSATRLWRDKIMTTSDTHSFHTYSPLFSSVQTEGSSLTTENLIEVWFNEVTTFGTVHIRNVPFDVRIQPLNPMDYPEQNKSIVKLYYDPGGSGQTLVGHTLSEIGRLCNTKVCVEEGRVDVTCDVPHGVKLPLVCVITVPLKFDVDLEGSHGGDVVIRDLENSKISVRLKHGHCHLTSLKTGSVTVHCDSGSITSNRYLLGSISLGCGSNGTIRADRLQGTSVDCVTEAGDVDIKTVYAEKWTCHCHSGDVHVRDCHADSTVSIQDGNLTIDSFDGKLWAELGRGTADVYITRQESIHIRSQKGDITLRFSENGSSSLDLEATIIEQDESLPTELNDQGKGFLRTETEHTVRASAPQGKISLKKQDWLSAIKLQFGSPSP